MAPPSSWSNFLEAIEFSMYLYCFIPVIIEFRVFILFFLKNMRSIYYYFLTSAKENRWVCFKLEHLHDQRYFHYIHTEIIL